MTKWLILFIPFWLSAAAPLTHLYLADLFCQVENIQGEERNQVLKGSVFPDIRYVAKVSRTKTHKKKVSYEEILAEPDPFKKGMLHHSWVDIIREKIVAKSGVYPIIRETARGHNAIYLKFIEDQVLFPTCPSAEYRKIYATTYPIEYQLGIDKEDVDRWNTFIALYLSKSPQETVSAFALLNLPMGPISTSTLAFWTDKIGPLAQNEKISNTTHQFIDHFSNLYKKLTTRQL